MASFVIVDRDRNFREALAIALRLEGHEALAAGDAAAALARLHDAPVDCCLVDPLVPGADALLEAASTAGARAFATGPHADLLASVAARHPGAGVLAKPLSARDLEACVPGRCRAAG